MLELEAAELFHGLGRKDLETLREISRDKNYPGGSQIFREGDPGDGLYLILSGSVQIADVVGSEVRHLFSVFAEGEVFGEMAVIENQPRSATALAVTDTRTRFFPREAVRTLLQNSAGLAFNMLKLVSHRLREFDQLHLRELVQSESLALVGRFAQGIVHDLKNPLSVIGLSAEMLDLPQVAPEARTQAQSRIKKQLERIGNLVGDILIFTEGKKRLLSVKTLDYGAFIAELLPDLREEAEVKSGRLLLQGDVPSVRIRLDPRRLSRVFHNLVHNATDMMGKGGTVYLRFRANRHELLTEVEDTGPGIAPEIADQLFQPFSSHGKSQGTGLGLSICKKIIEDHGGKIFVDRQAGHGAIFCFTLPLAQ